MNTSALANMPRFKEGDKIGGQYEVLSLLGTGGMSDVYRCDDLVLKRKVAVKVLHIDPEQAPQAIMRLQQEGQATARLEHKNIVKPYGASVTLDGIPYLVMQIVDGQSLSTLLKGGPISWSRTVRIIDQISDALAHAHEKGVVHRDLKPSNIMVENVGKPNEQAKLLDFGIAKITAGAGITVTKAGEVFGTPAFMSPEQAEGKSADARADQYALGCLLFEMVCGSPPFTGDTALAVLMQHCQAKPPSIVATAAEKLPAHVESVYQRMLAKEPEKRFDTVKEAKAALLGDANFLIKQTLQELLLNRWAALVLIIGIICSVYPLFMWRQVPTTEHQSLADQSAENDLRRDLTASMVLNDDRMLQLLYMRKPFVDSINLSNKSLSPQGVKILPEFHSLKKLILYKCQGIDDNALKGLVNLPLESLNVAHTAVSDEGMKSIAKLTNLRELLLSAADITDAGCAQLANLKKLETVNLNGLLITDKTLKVIAKLPITHLRLDGDRQLVKSYAQLKPLKLKILFLGQDDLGDSELSTLSSQKDLESLNIRDNHVTDAGFLSATKDMKLLKWLYLANSGVSPALTAQLQKRWPKCQIDFNQPKYSAGITAADEDLIKKF